MLSFFSPASISHLFSLSLSLSVMKMFPKIGSVDSKAKEGRRKDSDNAEGKGKRGKKKKEDKGREVEKERKRE